MSRLQSNGIAAQLSKQMSKHTRLFWMSFAQQKRPRSARPRSLAKSVDQCKEKSNGSNVHWRKQGHRSSRTPNARVK